MAAYRQSAFLGAVVIVLSVLITYSRENETTTISSTRTTGKVPQKDDITTASDITIDSGIGEKSTGSSVTISSATTTIKGGPTDVTSRDFMPGSSSTGPDITTPMAFADSTSTGPPDTTNSSLLSPIKVAHLLNTSSTTFKEFQTITLRCRTAVKDNISLSWYFRHATSYYVMEYGYDASMPLDFFDRFKDRHTVKETVTNDHVTTVLEVSSALPGDMGWYSCVDEVKKVNTITYVKFVYESCRDNGVYTEEFGCIEFISEDACINTNGSLAVIHSSRKDKWIFDLAFHLDKAADIEVKLGLTLSANTMLWKDFMWSDGSSLTFVEWFGYERTATSCPRCLEEDVPLALGIKFHMDTARVWQWVDTQEVVCEWPTKQNLTGISIAPANTTYKGDKELFRCTESGEYISGEFVCDTVRDCVDQSDEEKCGPECSGTSFQCNCGGCISASLVCDFYKDCVDGSDEDNCYYPLCDDDYWMCDSRECIPPYDVCDGEVECADGSDEMDTVCKENAYSPTPYSHKCVNPKVIFPSARLCDMTVDCLDIRDEDTVNIQCPYRVYSCGSLIYTADSNVSSAAVNMGLIEYGATQVTCTAKNESMDTNWPFEQELASRPLSTYSGKPLLSDAVWIDIGTTAFTSIEYINLKTQLQLIYMATSCVQYIRGCKNVMGRAKDAVSVEWTSGTNEDHVNALATTVGGCGGYCSLSECKLTPSVRDTQIPKSPEEADKYNWVAITDKNQLPISHVRANYMIIIGISPLICTESAMDVDPTYMEEHNFCKNGMIFYSRDRCLMDFDPTGQPTACRDLTHLQDCGEFECPENYVKCPGSFCLHMRFVCDGRNHCPRQEDELECETKMCDGHYACRESKQCIPFSQLCDGVRQCRRGDDEFNCHPHCPANCECRGMTFKCESGSEIIPINQIHSDARWIDMKTNMSDMRPHVPIKLRFLTTLLLRECSIHELLVDEQSIFQGMPALQYLDLSSNLIETLSWKTFQKVTKIKTLILSNNPLSHIDRDFFQGLPFLNNLQITHTSLSYLQTQVPSQSILKHLSKLEYLDLSFNSIEEIPRKVFADLSSLKYLNLSHNPVISVDTEAFYGMHFLRDLRFTHTTLQQIRKGVFDDVKSLIHLNVSAGHIQDIQKDVFSNLENLQALDIHQNLLQIHEFMFKGLDSLAYLYADSYQMCCIKPESVASSNCFAPKESISSCSNLVGIGVLRVFLWIIGITAVVGNLFVIIYRTIIDRKHMKKSYSLFVINLSISDFLMGVYMLIIAAVDTHYSGRYVSYDKTWRESILCATAGIISMISSEMSTFIIFLITIDRFIAIVFPLSTHKLTWRSAMVVISVFWFITFGIAVAPQVVFQSYFKGEFYSRSGVCLALPLTGEHSPGDGYAVAIFIGLNSLVFLLIVMAQVYIYRTMKGSGSLAATQNRRTEIELAKSLFLVVATDFCCWFPIGIIGVWSQTGGSVSPDVYAWVMVLVLPINSAINPFLYTYTYIKRKRMTSSSKRSTTSFTTERGSSTFGSTKKNQQAFFDLAQTNVLKEIYFSKMFERKRRDISLETYIRDQLLSPAEAFQIARHVIKSLSFLHNRGIIHDNVSKERVFITKHRQNLTRATLVMDSRLISLQHEGPHVDILNYGMLVKTLLRRLDKR